MFFVFFNDTATTEIYTLSLHDALPISGTKQTIRSLSATPSRPANSCSKVPRRPGTVDCIGRSHPDRKSTRLNSSHANISYAVFCLKKKNNVTFYAYLTTHIEIYV